MPLEQDINSYKVAVNEYITSQTNPNSIPPEIVGGFFAQLADIIKNNLGNNSAAVNITSGSGAPSNLSGSNNDMYFQAGSPLKIWKKVVSTWIEIASVPMSSNIEINKKGTDVDGNGYISIEVTPNAKYLNVMVVNVAGDEISLSPPPPYNKTKKRIEGMSAFAGQNIDIQINFTENPAPLRPEPASYDTALTFGDAVTKSAFLVTFTVPAVNNVVKIEFNKREGAIGSAVNPGMTIIFNDAVIGMADFVQDYLGDWFRITTANGTVKTFVVKSGEVYL